MVTCVRNVLVLRTESGSLGASILALALALAGEPFAYAQAGSANSAATGQPNNDAAMARNLYREARELSTAGKLSQALEKYREAFAVLPTPTLLWPIAELSLQLGQPVEGLSAIRQYRQMVAPTEMEPGHQSADADRLEKRLRERLGTMHFSGGNGALVILDGRELGRAPLNEPQTVNPGSHRVEYTTARGVQTATIEVAPGSEQTVAIVEPPPGPGESSDQPQQPRYKMHPLPAVLLGLSAGALGAATVLGGLALGKTLDLTSQCGGTLCIGTQSTDIGGLADSVTAQHTFSASAILLFGTGSVLLASSVILVAVDVHRQRRGHKLFSMSPAPRLKVAASGGPGSFMLLAGGRF